MANAPRDYVIRPLTTLDELAQVETLQRAVWSEPSLIIYQHMLISFVQNGALVLGAIKDGNVIGFLLGFLGLENHDSPRPAMANLKMVSQRMAVLPEYRNAGIGYELKLAQRQYAIKQGIRLVTWTFDPLISRNAHLNIRKLGAIVREYRPDYYGAGDSPMAKLGSTDRLIAEWWVTNNRVEQRIHGNRGGLSLSSYTDATATVLNPTRVGADGLLYPSEHIYEAGGTVALVEIPDNYDDIVTAAPELAKQWRHHSRDLLRQVLGAGYIVTDFVRGSLEGRARAFYAFSLGDVIGANNAFSMN